MKIQALILIDLSLMNDINTDAAELFMHKLWEF